MAAHDRVWADVACLEPAPPDADCSILYLHGGGYRLGQAESWQGFAGRLAARLSARIVLPDYRLAPEHPFPAALRDAVAVLGAMTADGGRVVVAGDSAGGGLAVATTLAARDAGSRLPCATVLLSPWLDLTLSGDSFETRADRDLFFPRASAADAATQYLQGHSAADPLVSPLFADLDGFPPTLILAGGDETLLADSTRFVARLADAGTTIEAHVVAGMQHVWPILYPDLPETAHAFAAIAGFVARVAKA